MTSQSHTGSNFQIVNHQWVDLYLTSSISELRGTASPCPAEIYYLVHPLVTCIMHIHVFYTYYTCNPTLKADRISNPTSSIVLSDTVRIDTDTKKGRSFTVYTSNWSNFLSIWPPWLMKPYISMIPPLTNEDGFTASMLPLVERTRCRLIFCWLCPAFPKPGRPSRSDGFGKRRSLKGRPLVPMPILFHQNQSIFHVFGSAFFWASFSSNFLQAVAMKRTDLHQGQRPPK